jgi:uncharacterized membrane-anchored protein
MTKTTKFAAAVGIQVLIILVIIVYKLAIMAGGTDVMLHIMPIDPRDMLRGDYATFRFDISQVPAYKAYDLDIKTGDTVYVALQQSGKYWIASRITKTIPRDNSIFIKGRITSAPIHNQPHGINYVNIDMVPTVNVYNQVYDISYGIEQYFIPEGKGTGLTRTSNAAALVTVDDKGNAVIKRMYVNDKVWP